MTTAPTGRKREAGRADKPRPAPAKTVAADEPEVGGRDGPEPTRYGDWEVKGICTDF